MASGSAAMNERRRNVFSWSKCSQTKKRCDQSNPFGHFALRYPIYQGVRALLLYPIGLYTPGNEFRSSLASLGKPAQLLSAKLNIVARRILEAVLASRITLFR
jgi:hypothetical protein